MTLSRSACRVVNCNPGCLFPTFEAFVWPILIATSCGQVDHSTDWYVECLDTFPGALVRYLQSSWKNYNHVGAQNIFFLLPAVHGSHVCSFQTWSPNLRSFITFAQRSTARGWILVDVNSPACGLLIWTSPARCSESCGSSFYLFRADSAGENIVQFHYNLFPSDRTFACPKDFCELNCLLLLIGARVILLHTGNFSLGWHISVLFEIYSFWNGHKKWERLLHMSWHLCSQTAFGAARFFWFLFLPRASLWKLRIWYSPIWFIYWS